MRHARRCPVGRNGPHIDIPDRRLRQQFADELFARGHGREHKSVLEGLDARARIPRAHPHAGKRQLDSGLRSIWTAQQVDRRPQRRTAVMQIFRDTVSAKHGYGTARRRHQMIRYPPGARVRVDGEKRLVTLGRQSRNPREPLSERIGDRCRVPVDVDRRRSDAPGAATVANGVSQHVYVRAPVAVPGQEDLRSTGPVCQHIPGTGVLPNHLVPAINDRQVRSAEYFVGRVMISGQEGHPVRPETRLPKRADKAMRCERLPARGTHRNRIAEGERFQPVAVHSRMVARRMDAEQTPAADPHRAARCRQRVIVISQSIPRQRVSGGPECIPALLRNRLG